MIQVKGILIFGLLTALAACSSEQGVLSPNSHELVSAGGEVYLLNKKSGALSLIQSDRKIDVEAVGTSSVDPLGILGPRVLRFSEKVGGDQVLTVSGAVKAVGGTVKVRGLIEPYIGKLRETSGAGVTLSFMDADGFLVGRQAISSSELTRVFGGPDIYEGYSFQLDVPIRESDLLLVSSVYATWYTSLDDAVRDWLTSADGKAWQSRQKGNGEPLDPEQKPADP